MSPYFERGVELNDGEHEIRLDEETIVSVKIVGEQATVTPRTLRIYVDLEKGETKVADPTHMPKEATVGASSFTIRSIKGRQHGISYRPPAP